MPTPSPEEALSVEEARAAIATSEWSRDEAAPELGRIGLEPEMFALSVDEDGAPLGRFPLEGEGGVIEVIDELAQRVPWLEARDPTLAAPVYDLANGGRLTFEPGAQIEHSTAVHDTAAEALADVGSVREALCGAFRARGAVLGKVGIDLWNDVAEIPQQLRAPRYNSMAAYFDRRGPLGRTMMRHTTSCQINLDLGPPGVAEERWRLANLASPWITATFASSPSTEAVSERARAWQGLDPTRTGFPARFLAECGNDPAAEISDALLAADVMLFLGSDGGATTGEPGFSFGHWIREGHPEHGWPTAADFAYHRTTVFMEVRCRGFLELRACDALPEPWDAVPAVLLPGLLYDTEARLVGLELLGGHCGELDRLWTRAAVDGLRDPVLGKKACDLWDLALEGARRLPAGWFLDSHLEVTADFLERFTRKSRMPADELGLAMEISGQRALEWAAGDAPCPDAREVGA